MKTAKTEILVCCRCKIKVEIEGSPVVTWNEKLEGWPEGWVSVGFSRREVFVSKAKPSLGKKNVSNNTAIRAFCPKCIKSVEDEVFAVLRKVDSAKEL